MGRSGGLADLTGWRGLHRAGSGKHRGPVLPAVGVAAPAQASLRLSTDCREPNIES